MICGSVKDELGLDYPDLAAGFSRDVKEGVIYTRSLQYRYNLTTSTLKASCLVGF